MNNEKHKHLKKTCSYYDKGGEKMATKIFIDPGHGGFDPGAVGNGVTEQAVNLNVANYLTEILINNGYEVMQYRTTRDENVLSNKNADLSNRANMANNWGANYFISIHSTVIFFIITKNFCC